MVAIVRGFDSYKNENFQYTIENITSVQYANGKILITHFDKDGNMQTSAYTQTSLNGNVVIY